VAKRLTIIVPAYNEAARLATTVTEILHEAMRALDTFEVIIVNDGSSDATGTVADELAREHAAVKVIHQPINRGVGAAYYTALEQAAYDYLTLVPGDNAFHWSGLRTLFGAVGEADLIISYRANIEARTPLRRLLSRTCTCVMRHLTGCPIRDTHSMFVFPVAQARRLRPSSGYGYHMDALATLLQRVGSYREVPVVLNPKPDASSRVMRLRPLASLVWTVLGLYVRRLTQGWQHGRRCAVCRSGGSDVPARPPGADQQAA
jgi:glycosyltransferase involved in cell wall biosynthesis